MANSPKKTPIRYTSRDYSSIHADLVEHAKKYYPTSFRDFSEGSFGSLMLDAVSMIGDSLSFYLDYQSSEGFLDTAVEAQNILRHSRRHGFKFTNAPSATGIVVLFALVPANSVGLGPDINYFPILKKGTQFTSENGNGYILQADVRFDDPNNEIVVARVDPTSGTPTYYAVKASGTVISGKITQEVIQAGEFERFKRLRLSTSKITEIMSVFDDEGHEYVQVDYLSQNVVFREIKNKSTDKDTVPAILKPYIAPRRFTLERDRNELYLQFGYGSDDELSEPSVVDPTNIILEMFGRDFITDTSFDPSKLLSTDKFGIVPANTNLIVTERVNTSDNPNTAAGSLTQVTKRIVEFNDVTLIDAGTRREVENSIEVFNEEPIIGSVSYPTNEEIKRRTFDFFATQNRAVTKQDYEAICYAMPGQYGAVKRVSVVRDASSFKKNLNLYVLSENDSGKLCSANMTLKENLKVWLANYKGISETIDILDAYIINFGVEFTVFGNPEKNKFDVLKECIGVLQSQFKDPLFIGEPIDVSNITRALNKLNSVVGVKKVKIIQKSGSPTYSDTRFNMDTALSADGTYVKAPMNCCFEVKLPSVDFKGTVL